MYYYGYHVAKTLQSSNVANLLANKSETEL